MKKILPLLVIMVWMSSTAQSELESLILSEVNTYRASYKLQLASWGVIPYKAATHHSRWMSKVGFSKISKLMSDENTGLNSHYETIDVPNFVEILDPIERGKKFGLPGNTSVTELCTMASVNQGVRRLSDDKIAKDIIERFRLSPGHNEGLLQEINIGSKLTIGVSSIIDGEIAYVTIYFIEEFE
jgi:hypothetical protein